MQPYFEVVYSSSVDERFEEILGSGVAAKHIPDMSSHAPLGEHVNAGRPLPDCNESGRKLTKAKGKSKSRLTDGDDTRCRLAKPKEHANTHLANRHNAQCELADCQYANGSSADRHNAFGTTATTGFGANALGVVQHRKPPKPAVRDELPKVSSVFRSEAAPDAKLRFFDFIFNRF